jgi:hypothetical protein
LKPDVRGYRVVEGRFSALATFCTLEQFSLSSEAYRQGILFAQGIIPLGYLRRSLLDQVDEDVAVEQVIYNNARS